MWVELTLRHHSTGTFTFVWCTLRRIGTAYGSRMPSVVVTSMPFFTWNCPNRAHGDELAGDDVVPGQHVAAFIDADACAVRVHRAVVAALDFILAAPQRSTAFTPLKARAAPAAPVGRRAVHPRIACYDRSDHSVRDQPRSRRTATVCDADAVRCLAWLLVRVKFETVGRLAAIAIEPQDASAVRYSERRAFSNENSVARPARSCRRSLARSHDPSIRS